MYVDDLTVKSQTPPATSAPPGVMAEREKTMIDNKLRRDFDALLDIYVATTQRAEIAEAEVAALRARIAELEAENLDLISEIVQTDCRDYGRGEYQTGSSTNQELIDRLVAAGRMRHKRSDHKDRPIYEFVHVSSKEAPAS